jgi:hypothetical protein
VWLAGMYLFPKLRQSRDKVPILNLTYARVPGKSLVVSDLTLSVFVLKKECLDG